MRKFILTIMTLICTFALAMGTLAACDVSPSSPSVNLEITGKPDGNEITLTSEVNTLALGCNQTGVTWSSSDTSVATVSGGVVTLHSVGSTTITATKGDQTDSFVLVVVREQNASSETVTVEGFPQNGEVSFADRTLQLSATCSDESEIEWISENKSVATVDQTGKVTFLNLGSVDIVAQKKGDARVYAAHTLEIVMPNATSEDFSNAEIVGDYVVGNTAIRFGKALSPEIVQEGGKNYLKYSRPKTDASYIYEDNYAVFSFGGLEKGARYVLKYRMKVLSCNGSYDHQINLYSDYGVPVNPRAPQIGNVYSFSLTCLDSNKGKVYQSGSEALYRDGKRWSRADSSTDDFHEYTLGFIAGESTVGFGFVSMTNYEVQYDYIRVDKAPELTDFKLSAKTPLEQGETYQIEAVAADETELYYQPLQLTYQSSDTSVATVDEYGMVTGIAPGTVTITATRTGESGTVEKTIDIKVIPEIDKASYDIFYEDGDINEWGYAIKDPIKLPEGTQFKNVKKDDSYKVTLEIDAISYTGTNAQFYLAVRNDTAGDPGVINHTGWIQFPVASGEKKTIEYVLDATLAADLNATQLAVYVCNVTNCLIGVKVVSVELLASPYDSLIKNSDIDPNGYAIKDPIVLSEAKQGKRLDEYKVTLDIDAKSYTSNQANGKIGLYVAVMNETNGVIGHTGWIEFPVAAGEKATKVYTLIAECDVIDWTVSKVAVYVCNVTACEIGVDVKNVELVSKDRDLVINATGLTGEGYVTWPAPIVLSSEMQKPITDTTGRYKVTLKIDATYTPVPGQEKIGWYVALRTNTDGDSGVIGHTGWVDFTVPSGTTQTVEVVIDANLLKDVTLTKLAVYVRFVKDCSISVKVASIEPAS